MRAVANRGPPGESSTEQNGLHQISFAVGASYLTSNTSDTNLHPSWLAQLAF